MKKSLSQAIALATLVGGAAAAHAVEVNHEGIGGALLYPIYTVNDGNTSLVSVVNTTDNYKAVKVRFVEAKNSAEVLDFHLYLSPKDVWSGTIVPTSTGAKLVSNDNSCIAGISANDGSFPSEGLAFRTEQIVKDEERIAAANRSTAEQLVERVRVGHFEAIEMGEIGAGTPTVQTNNPPLTLQQAIKHKDNTGIPGGCDVVTSWWVNDLVMDGNDRTNKLGDAAYGEVTAPTGGLYGTAGIVNVVEGWAASYDAVALAKAGFTATDTAFYPSAQHPRPGSIYPHLATLTSATDTNQEAFGGAGTGFVVPDDARLDAVTTALNLSKLYNDYYVEPALDAGTELVVTFPTKRFYTFEAVDLDTAAQRYIYTNDLAGIAYDPSVNGGLTVAADPEGAGWAKDVHTASVFETRWDNVKKTARVGFKSPILYGNDEQKEVTPDGFISPRPLVAGEIDLNYETNVISLNGSNSLGTAGLVAVDVQTPFMQGWLELERVGAAPRDKVPAVGFANITTKNGVSADGALRNFAQTFKNKTVK